ncbi:response regulator [Aquimarina sp. M1]
MKRIDLVYILDNDPVFVYGIKRLMEMMNFCESVIVYKNGLDALNNLKSIIVTKEQLPDIILLDLNMPVLDGWQFLDEFVKIPCKEKITIYIVSSSVNPEDVFKARSYEIVSDYIVKPVSTKTLEGLLQGFEETN